MSSLCGDDVPELYSCEVCKRELCADDEEGCIQYQRDRFTCLICECGRVQNDEAGHWIGTDGVCLECKNRGKGVTVVGIVAQQVVQTIMNN